MGEGKRRVSDVRSDTRLVPSTRLLTPLVSSFFLHSFRAGGDWKETTSRERDEGTGASEEMTDGRDR